MEVYCAVLMEIQEMMTETEAKILDEQSLKELEGKKILFVGDGAKKRKRFYKFLEQILTKMCIHQRNISSKIGGEIQPTRF